MSDFIGKVVHRGERVFSLRSKKTAKETSKSVLNGEIPLIDVDCHRGGFKCGRVTGYASI